MWKGHLRRPLNSGLSRDCGDHNTWGYSRDLDLRLDHLQLSPELSLRLKKAGVDRAVRSAEGASDHVPEWISARWISWRNPQLRRRDVIVALNHACICSSLECRLLSIGEDDG